jgi:hypothetical protein
VGPLGEKWRPLFGKFGEWYVKAGTSKAIAPLVSVKDRWVDPREQVLNVSITRI